VQDLELQPQLLLQSLGPSVQLDVVPMANWRMLQKSWIELGQMPKREAIAHLEQLVERWEEDCLLREAS